MKKNEVDISVIIAAYNEEIVITRTLQRIIDELNKRRELVWEIIIINDGSNDCTGELIEKAASSDPRVKYFHHGRNYGQGKALRTGFEHCVGKVIVTMDADLSYGPEYIHILYDAIYTNKVDIALASPYSKSGEVRNVPLFRHLLSRYANLYLAKMIRYHIKTCTCVVRAYSQVVIEALNLSANGMELQIEILMKASLTGFSVCEVPAVLEWANENRAENQK